MPAPVTPPRVEVSLNAVTADGSIRVRVARFDRPVRVGQRVTAIPDPDDDWELPATVIRIDDRTGLAYLDVHWPTSGTSR
jgi:hypothetical protein